jgi:hypothetical protein
VLGLLYISDGHLGRKCQSQRDRISPDSLDHDPAVIHGEGLADPQMNYQAALPDPLVAFLAFPLHKASSILDGWKLCRTKAT